MTTKVFVSWSGTRSRAVAEAVDWWVPRVNQHLTSFMSRDIEKGARWGEALVGHLRSCKAGIICLTEDNLTSPWLQFEAGAILNAWDKSKVMTLLIGVAESDIPQSNPLIAFQNTKFDEKDLLALTRSLNNVLGDNKVPDHILDDSFKGQWSEFEKKIKLASAAPVPATTAALNPREMILDQLLGIAREHGRKLAAIERELAQLNPGSITPERVFSETNIISGAVDYLEQLRSTLNGISMIVNFSSREATEEVVGYIAKIVARIEKLEAELRNASNSAPSGRVLRRALLSIRRATGEMNDVWRPES